MAYGYCTLILDLGGVLLDWDPHSVKTLSSSQLRIIMHSETWYNLDRGLISLDQACDVFVFGRMIDQRPSDVMEGLDQAQRSLTIKTSMVELIQELKKLNPSLRVYVMSNISREHFQVVQRLELPWTLFDGVFVSGHVGMRKPDPCFIKYVVNKIECDPKQVIMVDDQAENICSVRSIGVQGLLLTDDSSVNTICQTLRNLSQNAISRAEAYLEANRGKHHSVVEGSDITIRDNFAQLLILEVTQNAGLVYFKFPSGKLHPCGRAINGTDKTTDVSMLTTVKSGLWNYFYEDPILTTRKFPADADTTSTAYLALAESDLSEVANVQLVLDEMVTNQSPDGVMQTYFCNDRPRTNPEVCVNILRVFYRFGRGGDSRIKQTEDWVVQCLENRACLYGDRFYTTPESFLYFVARLYKECEGFALKDRLLSIREALIERINIPTNALSLALRVAACQEIGLEPGFYRMDLEKFLLSQEQDGGFPAGHFCSIGRTGARIGNRGLTTALARRILWVEEQNNSEDFW
ncbi:HAD-like protein [Aspergillus ambiguus]|uniref:HAD-like protein n=1 Tax=Aspergillus ambiguus TaxID=176160 RepID=UPI003CCD13AB